MAFQGPVPAADSTGWIDVVNVPFSGEVPVEVPLARMISTPTGPAEVDVLRETHDWWDALSAMPHCVLWTGTDWQFALATALVADMAFRGVTAAAVELRNREKVMGCTIDQRRALRIRYVDSEVEDSGVDDSEPQGNVVSMDRRNRINAS